MINLKGSMGEDLAPTDSSDVALVNSAVVGYEDFWIGISTAAGTTGYFDNFELVHNSH